jgi:hypothetical protein
MDQIKSTTAANTMGAGSLQTAAARVAATHIDEWRSRGW